MLFEYIANSHSLISFPHPYFYSKVADYTILHKLKVHPLSSETFLACIYLYFTYIGAMLIIKLVCNFLLLIWSLW